ncbi:hypothetical protein J2X20_005678 [Pelomonas saccharophila]|uniref:AraC family transcriptional regulator n=1 Tax=Roseateles saccharophilus TaxID=304 RepID=A0ABU1YVW1_ROSSA|nr:hypothetical protein [Roseateles saccharophilus]MDR7272993.1 hypothetical protein [Roseateles saccharophilus]
MPADEGRHPPPTLDRVLNPNQAQVAHPQATPETPRLDAFTSAASVGPLLWASQVEGRLEVQGGVTPAGVVSDEIGRLFVIALREHFGEAASAIAEREWRLNGNPRRLLQARVIKQAVACAESALSLLLAQSCLVQIEFSAVMLGWRFRRVAEGLGLDPASLGIERRQALDDALAPDFRLPPPADADALAERLRTLLSQVPH